MTIPALALMSALRSGNATAPRLTWYGPESERIELSGRVLDNWVAKTANLLQDELDAEPGMVLTINMPAHWKSIVWVLAAWQVGMTVDFGGHRASAGGIYVTDSPEESPAGSVVVAVALGALAMRWPGALADGVVDYSAEVRSHGDVFEPWNSADPASAALYGGDGASVSHTGLLTEFPVDIETGSRILVSAHAGLEKSLRRALGAWSADGSVVLVHSAVEISSHLMAMEHVSAGATE